MSLGFVIPYIWFIAPYVPFYLAIGLLTVVYFYRKNSREDTYKGASITMLGAFSVTLLWLPVVIGIGIEHYFERRRKRRNAR